MECTMNRTSNRKGNNVVNNSIILLCHIQDQMFVKRKKSAVLLER